MFTRGRIVSGKEGNEEEEEAWNSRVPELPLKVNGEGKQPILLHLHSLTLGVSVFFGSSFS